VSCPITVELNQSVFEVVLESSPVVVEVPATSDVVLELNSTVLEVTLEETTAVLVELCEQGPSGPQGPDPDYVFPTKPNATLTYNGSGQLTRVDYADGTYKDLTYTGELLTQIQGENISAETVTKTLTYNGNQQLTNVTTVVT
jgi:hypothetical protein